MKHIIFASCLSLLSLNAYAVDEINALDSIALHGYDPVSYFDGEPERGKQGIYVVQDKVKYLFVSGINKEKFQSEPAHYMPMYGGYCAYGIRMGKKLDIDPLSYEVKDGQLYVMLNRATHKLWKQDINNNIQVSDRIWPDIKSKPVNLLH